MAEPETKKARRDILGDFLSTFSFEHFTESCESVCRGNGAGILNLKINMCDAGIGWGTAFSSARCTTEPIFSDQGNMKKGHALGRIFLKGNRILQNFSESKTPPKDDRERELLERLLQYVCNKESQRSLYDKIFKASTDTKVAKALAEHLFSQLSSSATYTLDNGVQSRSSEASWEDQMEDKVYRNTSLGLSDGWHGRLDILMGSCDLGVLVKTKDSSQGAQKLTEVKNDTYKVDIKAKEQAIAQTIVFSFLQKKRHTEFGNFAIPNIAASKDDLVFYFYDSEHDVLMQSSPISIWNPFEKAVSVKAIIALWLVLNYKWLGTGLSKRMKKRKANFFELAGNSLESYRNEVTIGKSIESVPMFSVYTLGVMKWQSEFSDDENSD